ncbi:MAG: signal peptidase II [Clostridia bacterium]|nr:signal peptidase II [Clostridia bacterium]
MTDKKKRYIIFIAQMAGAAILAFADRLFKIAAVTHLKGKDDIVIIKNFLALSYQENTGAAFSSFSDHTVLLSIFTLILLVAGIIYLFLGKLEGKILNICAVLVLGGGIGNLIDRFEQGYVVDYIKTLFVDFPVFNFADMLVVVGAFTICGVLIYQIVQEEKARKRAKHGVKHDGKS